MRSGFSMVLVIFFMVLMSTIIAVSLKNVNSNYENVQNTKNIESAKLFLDNAIELVILSISQYERVDDCMYELNVFDDDYNVTLKITHYLTLDGMCDGLIIQTPQSVGTIFIDAELIGDNIRLFKHVVQKI